ncbi:hypothetical protein A2U01_0111941, partial [Trifolium medium]|nr:hypothetical protein [Trifolium medium]
CGGGPVVNAGPPAAGAAEVGGFPATHGGSPWPAAVLRRLATVNHL